jgi:hypothetical protein
VSNSSSPIAWLGITSIYAHALNAMSCNVRDIEDSVIAACPSLIMEVFNRFDTEQQL